MVLESDIECVSKAIHVVVFSKKEAFYVGRRINNDITISDISVSRNQAAIKLKGDKVFVEDCDSKFGTFVKVNGSVKVPITENLPIQIEKKCFFFRLEQRFSCMQTCFISCGLFRGREAYDHYLDVANKYPRSLKKELIGKPQELVDLNKTPTKASLIINKTSNRILDESVITQMTNNGYLNS